MFTMFEAVWFVFLLLLAMFLAFCFGGLKGIEYEQKRVFKILTDQSDPWDCLDAIREEVTGE